MSFPTPYPLDELLAMSPARPACAWGDLAGLGQCEEPPQYRTVLTGPDDVADLCREHVVRFATWANKAFATLPELGRVEVVPLEVSP